jgi:hypothetical protein
LLGGAHGISVTDLLAPLADEASLRATVRRALIAELQAEYHRFRAATGLDAARFRRARRRPQRRSGVAQFLQDCQ